MTELRSDVIQYILKVDRAVTVEEVCEELGFEGSEGRVKGVLEDLLEEDYLTADLFGEKVKTCRYYPDDKLFEEFR